MIPSAVLQPIQEAPHKPFYFALRTNGPLPTCTKVHCLGNRTPRMKTTSVCADEDFGT